MHGRRSFVACSLMIGIPDSKDPHFKWDLQKAWQEAEVADI